jgi:hypothetical protein
MDLLKANSISMPTAKVLPQSLNPPICNALLRLLAASIVHSVTLNRSSYADSVLITAASLTSLMQQCQSLKALTLEDLKMGENPSS